MKQKLEIILLLFSFRKIKTLFVFPSGIHLIFFAITFLVVAETIAQSIVAINFQFFRKKHIGKHYEL